MKTTLTVLAVLGFMSVTPSMISTSFAQSIGQESENSIGSFCRDRLVILKAAARRAELEAQVGNISASVAILEKGLKDASLRINPRFDRSLTSKAIKRGMILLSELKKTAEDRKKTKTINNFLFNYYMFIEDVSNNLDIPYYSPISGYRSISNSNMKFERLFIKFAKDQVKMSLATMTVQDNGSVYPVGSPDFVLTALKVTTNAMANDLSDSIFAARYACTIQDLDNVSSDITDYLRTHEGYGDQYTAFQELVGNVESAVSGMRECGGHEEHRAGQSQTTTTDAISSSIRISDGETKQVRLSRPQYVKKLIISAEGVRSDAMFDVVVNGDVKGTVYVPGRDPSYVVTIEDSTQTIEFISRNGTSIISKILVVAE